MFAVCKLYKCDFLTVKDCTPRTPQLLLYFEVFLSNLTSCSSDKKKKSEVLSREPSPLDKWEWTSSPFVVWAILRPALHSLKILYLKRKVTSFIFSSLPTRGHVRCRDAFLAWMPLGETGNTQGEDSPHTVPDVVKRCQCGRVHKLPR